MYRILSIDGGGLRGLIPVLILKHIEKIAGKRIHEMFDFITGTSTGGLIACGLTMKGDTFDVPKYDLNFIENIYTEKGNKIFEIDHKLHNWWLKQDLSYLGKPKFDPKYLNELLLEIFDLGESNQATIRDCIKPLLISSYDLVTNSPLFFKTRYANMDQSKNPKLHEICRATSAAPTYFPPYKFRYPHKTEQKETNDVVCIDGGIFINNPTMAALVEIFKYPEEYGIENLNHEKVFVLSIGTGFYSEDISEKALTWGKMGWLKPITDVMMAGSNQIVDYQMSEALKFHSSTNYLRINIEIKEKKYSDMASSNKDTFDHMRQRVREEYLESSSAQEKLNIFFQNSGIST